ncbi:MAG: uroporphyrinogen decarboxylase family protein, partial [Candidatus Hydrogenedentales bacterium]
MSDVESKCRRVLAALNHEEADRVPVGDFFWTNFLKRCRCELRDETGRVLGDQFDPYTYWDLDVAVVNPNMDPRIQGIRLIENSEIQKVVTTGFGATIVRKSVHPMPYYAEFATQSFDQFDALHFDDPHDPRRYFEAIDDQINSVGDDLVMGYPSFAERVKHAAQNCCVFGGICEPHEMVWRIMGTENVLMKLAEDPDHMGQILERLGDFLVGIVKGQIAAAEGLLSGMYVWGDVAYDRGMFFSPDMWRELYKPQVKRICDAIHEAGLKVVYHGCGNASAVYEDLIDIGVDAYNPLEAKAGLNVVELKRHFGNRLAFIGNIDVRVLATNDRDLVRREILTKLNAAKGGGYILQSDHSMPDNVSPETYSY